MFSNRRIAGGKPVAGFALTLIITALLIFSMFVNMDNDGSALKEKEEEPICANTLSGPTNITLEFHMHFDGVPDNGDDTDFMNMDGPYNPPVLAYDYDNDGKFGITLKKNNSPNPPFRHHYFISEPPNEGSLHIDGDANFTFWARSRDNDSRIELNASIYDSDDLAFGGDVLIATSGIFQDPWLSEDRQYVINFTSIDYVVPENHSLILELYRSDTRNDELYIPFDQTVFDAILMIEIAPSDLVSIDIYISDTNISAGETEIITAMGKNNFNISNYSWVPFWSIDYPSIANLSVNGYNATVTGISVGNATISCRDNATNISVQININVIAAQLANIVVTPDSSSVWEGRTMNIQAEGFDALENPVDISSAVWSSEGYTMSQVSGSGSTGIIDAGMIPESGTVRVSLGAVSNVSSIDVVTPPFGPSISSLFISPGFEDNPFSIDFSEVPWSDLNGTHDLIWFVTGVNNSLLTISHDYQSRSIVNIIPQPDQYGEDNVTFGVIDPDGYTNFKEVTIIILPVNDPPRFINDPPLEIYVKFDLPYTFDYDYYIDDIDDSSSELTLLFDPSNYVQVAGLSATFTFPDKFNGGSYYEILNMVISDGSLQDSRSIKVWATTDTPPDLVMPLPDFELNEGEVNVEMFDLDDYFIDIDGDVLYYSQGYEHVVIEIADQTNVVLISSPTEWSGQTTAVFVAHDPYGALRTDTILITVYPVNDPPEILPIPKIEVHYGVDYLLDLRTYVNDPDNGFEELTISTNDPDNVTYYYLTFPHLTIRYSANQTGGDNYTGSFETQFLLRVTDAMAYSTSAYVTVRVSDNNPPRTTVNPPNLNIIFAEDEFLDKPNSINLFALFTDIDGDDLAFSYSGYDNISLSIDPDGWVNFSALLNWHGTETGSFKATDTKGAWDALSVRIDVSPVNDPPVIGQISNVNHYGDRNWSMSIEEYISDIDHDLSELQLIVDGSPYVRAVGLTLYFDFPSNVSSATIRIYVSDGESNSNVIELTVQVKKTIAELIGYPWSLPVILLLAGILGYIIARRIPMPHEFEDLFLIHNDGRLINHVGPGENNGLDSDIVSAMLTAVQEFIRDSFRESKGGLKMLEIGDKKLVIEKSRWIYAAMIYTGWPPASFFKTFAKFVDDVERKYGGGIKIWDGTLRSIPGIKEMCRDMIDNKYVSREYGEVDEKLLQEPVISDQDIMDMIDSDS